MTKSILASENWRPASVSFVVASALSAFMLFLGVRGLVAPTAAAKAFGLPLAGAADAVWLQIKGGRDISAGLSLVAFLGLRNRRLMAVFLLANLPSPLNDMLVSLNAPVHDTAYALAVHGGAATLMIVLAAFLLAGPSTSADERRPGTDHAA
jgi:hypothetical protein